MPQPSDTVVTALCWTPTSPILGVLGFLALSGLDDEGSGSTNFGLQLPASRPSLARERGLALQQKLNTWSIVELRYLPADEVNNAALWDLSTDPGSTVFAPSIDHCVVPTAPSVVFDHRDEQPVPILVGFNAREEDFFLAHSLPHQTSEEYISSTYIQANDSANALAGDLVIRQQTWEALDRHVRVGGQKGYGYYFTYSSPYSPLAMHTAEMNYIFGNMGPNESFTYTPPLSPAASGDLK
ncbi:hypothetical protein THAR02_02959 [Trichoderma harzianum]|uniref:Uncharacterized protein n=1 Tax=Trichoderma harzianum TaxID=5544 RepID=A0A0F9XY40_TRIHA|nr:hypothetical protein THAR02_02959 [Trichoderma harzianum]